MTSSSKRSPRAGALVFWRSIAFHAAFAVQLVAMALATLPVVLFFPRRHVLRVAQLWSSANLWLLETIVGIEVEIRGRENIPSGPALIASKHQSALETFALMPVVPDAVFVLKRELTWIPFFGWFLLRLRMIAIDRSAGGDALGQIIAQGRTVAAQGRQIVIFPEGTRRPIGAEPRYKQGVVHLYDQLRLPCTPVAINTGAFWPQGTLKRRRGRAVIAFLTPIPPGLDRRTFERSLRECIEQASDALAAEARAPDAPNLT